MSTQAQYASVPKLGRVVINTANTLRDGSNASTMGPLLAASSVYQKGTRIDKIQMQALSDTTAGMLRFFIVKGSSGVQISSISFVTTTATVTTALNHGLVTGDLVTIQNVMPDQYNVFNVAITVTDATHFTYTMPVAPTTAAITVGDYATVKAAEVPTFWREIPVTAATVAARVIASITNSTTTATLTTSTAHGLASGDVIVVTGATPANYNGTYTITVTGTTTFTYVMATAPGGSASVVGTYSVVKASFNRAMYSQLPADAGYLPLVLPAGWQLRVATNNAESFAITATFAGDI